MLMKTAALSLTEQLANRFAERIRTRLLAPGSRLPSVRQCAEQQQVSPTTVVAAYDQLLAQGLVEARKNRGFFVRELNQNRPLVQAGRAESAINNEVNKPAANAPTLGTQSTRSCSSTAAGLPRSRG